MPRMILNKTFLIFVFFIFCSFIIIKATLQKVQIHQVITQNDKNNSSRFGELIEPQIFHTKEGRPYLYLSATTAKINLATDDAELLRPFGKSFNLENGPMLYNAEKGFYLKKSSEIKLFGSVSINEEKSFLSAEQVIYKLNKDEILGEGNVFLKGELPRSKDILFISGNKFTYFPKRKISSFKENVNGRIQRREVYREGINFQTDQLDYFFVDSRIDLIGNVLFTKKPFSASSRNGQIYLNDKNKLNYFVLNDDVKLLEKNRDKGKSYERKAFAEKMEGFPDEGKFILTGYPRVFQENEIIKGIRIIVRENSNVVEVEEANTTLKIQKGTDGKNLLNSD